MLHTDMNESIAEAARCIETMSEAK